MKVKVSKTLQVEEVFDVTLIDVIANATDQEIVNQVLEIDKTIATWDFSLLLLNAIVDKNSQVLKNEDSLDYYYEPYEQLCKKIHSNILEIKTEIEKRLKFWERIKYHERN